MGQETKLGWKRTRQFVPVEMQKRQLGQDTNLGWNRTCQLVTMVVVISRADSWIPSLEEETCFTPRDRDAHLAARVVFVQSTIFFLPWFPRVFVLSLHIGWRGEREKTYCGNPCLCCIHNTWYDAEQQNLSSLAVS